MSHAPKSRRPILLLALLLIPALATGCVVTTFEGQGDPPRAAPRPVPVSDVDPASEGPGSATEPATAATADRGPEFITASHLLVMHRGSLRAPKDVTRTREEARLRAEEALERARAGEDFATLVATYSDEPGAKLREGRLGRFSREDMVDEFAEAAFSLKPGEYSEVVETPFGFHVILRSE